MTDPAPVDPKPSDRVSEKLKNDVKELKSVLIEVLNAIQEAEKIHGEPLMKEGTYLGVKFDE